MIVYVIVVVVLLGILARYPLARMSQLQWERHLQLERIRQEEETKRQINLQHEITKREVAHVPLQIQANRLAHQRQVQQEHKAKQLVRGVASGLTALSQSFN